MKENKYDDGTFFDKYSQMDRSKKGLEGAGEWHVLKNMLPDFKGKKVLDLGCGFGWHCSYAVAHGAESVLGVDISKKMLAEAETKNKYANVSYRYSSIEDLELEAESYDVVISSLTFHYLVSFEEIVKKVKRCLSKDSIFIFSVEHPVFTAQGMQDWYYDETGKILHWPVDDYFKEGKRKAVFLGESVTKYHKTMTTYIQTLIACGFEITGFQEPEPEAQMLHEIEGMTDELRRPMMLIISARKK